MNLCPCNSGKNFTACCSAIISGQSNAKTAVQLMRSRYTAFVIADSNYLLHSWHSDFCPKTLALDSSIKWINLEIIETKRNIVHFRAYSLSNDIVHVLEEKSNFIQINDQWFYTTGEIIQNKDKKISRNSPCPCGSGKKFKHCCLT